MGSLCCCQRSGGAIESISYKNMGDGKKGSPGKKKEDKGLMRTTSDIQNEVRTLITVIWAEARNTSHEYSSVLRRC